MNYSATIFLDTRRKKTNDLYPVKLRVYSSELKKAKMYATVFDLNIKDFQSIWKVSKPRNEYKEVRNKLRAVELRADDICQLLKPFSFIQFEKKFLQTKGDEASIQYHYTRIINDLKGQNSFGTASNYELSLKSLLDFITYSKGKVPSKFTFEEVTPEWLEKYERYMILTLRRSQTTVSMYLRALRTVFNTAIDAGEILPEIYPFRRKHERNKYVIPSVNNVKKALSGTQLRQLLNSKPKTPEQSKAKDFWFFSFACNGMNVKDIALLKYENLQDDKLIFYRAKTIRTTKTDLRPVTVYLNKFSKGVIQAYTNSDKSRGQFIFPILNSNMTEIEKHTRIKNFTKFVNQNLKKLALLEGLPGEISTYWARHSFATTAIRKGQSMEFVSEAFDHRNPSTTRKYFAGFADDVKKQFQQKIMQF